MSNATNTAANPTHRDLTSDEIINTRHTITVRRSPKGSPAAKAMQVELNGVVSYYRGKQDAIDAAQLMRRALESVCLDAKVVTL